MDKGAISYRRFLKGDDDAFVEIIRDYKDGLILYLDSFTHNLYTAEDLMEDTFVKLITKRPVFRGNASFKTWLYTIAGNVARDWYRKQLKQKERPVEDVPSDLIAAEDLEWQYLCVEQRIHLRRALRKINPVYAQVLYLIFFEDFSNTQVAAILKKDKRQVENLLYRAKLALKATLEKEGFVYEGL